MSKIINSSAADFKKDVLDAKTPVLVDFWAPWCGPCRAMEPILDQYSDDMDGKVKVVKVDVDNPLNKPLGAEYQIRSIPNMKIFIKGKVVHEIVGLQSKGSLASDVAKAIK